MPIAGDSATYQCDDGFELTLEPVSVMELGVAQCLCVQYSLNANRESVDYQRLGILSGTPRLPYIGSLYTPKY